MPIYFEELEAILNTWKMHSLILENDHNNIELKKRTISKIITLFETINQDNIEISEKANIDNTYGKITYDNIINISSLKSRL